MTTKTYFEAGTFVWNSDPEGYCQFTTLAEARAEYEYQREELRNSIKEYLRKGQPCRMADPSKRSVELNKVEAIYDDDGDLYDANTTRLEYFGSAGDWIDIREELENGIQ